LSNSQTLLIATHTFLITQIVKLNLCLYQVVVSYRAVALKHNLGKSF
jgi:hypothetical protein